MVRVTPEGEVMAKKMGRPKKSDRDDVPIKISRRLAGMIKLLAADRGVPIAEMLDDLVGPATDRAYGVLMRKLESKEGPKQ